MPFRETDIRAKVQFQTSAEMPYMIYQACLATGTRSNTVYIQHALCEALSRDLNIPLEDLVANLPPTATRMRSYTTGQIVELRVNEEVK